MDELDIWDPFKKIRKQENISRFFDSIPSFPKFDSMIRQPLVDIKDTGNSLKVTAELPGIKKQDLDIDLTESQLILKGKIDEKKEEKNPKQGYYFKERKFSSYFRAIPLPDEVIAGKAKAEFKDGILELTLPKKHQKKSKSFKVKVK
ncbi:Hsp20/alpha crystallin family protein [Candidatus Micrarchaeota archaeon]|nr:Hsp20/alpha crystallin family protein [Candidatus Micrarchaeota archaeon]MBU2476067.1 Hsp20/alpha crystallin family protein [Candidatus Micrarchaeota archaeon]